MMMIGEITNIIRNNLTVFLFLLLLLLVLFGSTLGLWAIQSPVPGHPDSVGHVLPLL